MIMIMMLFYQGDLISIEIANNTWARGDMKFIFECSTRYLTSERNLLYKFSSILSKGEYSKGHIRTHVFDTISEHMCSDTTFLSGQNPYNTL